MLKRRYLLFVVFGSVNAAPPPPPGSNPETWAPIRKKQPLPKAPQQVHSTMSSENRPAPSQGSIPATSSHKKHKWVAKDLQPTGKKLYQPVQYHPHQENPAWLAKQQHLANEVDKANANARWATQTRANGTYAMPDKAPAALQQLKNAQQNYNEFMTKGD